MRAPLTPVALAVLVSLAGCGGGGGEAVSTRPTVQSFVTAKPEGAWLFRPAGKPKRLVIFFHGQGGETETRPENHRAWIDHLVRRGAAVVYPRYEQVYSKAVLEPAVAGVRRASEELELDGLPVLALGYSRGAALAIEYAAVAQHQNVPVPDAIESVNPVPFGETARIVDLGPIRGGTTLALLISEADPLARDGTGLLLQRLRGDGFPGEQIELNVARSSGSFTADHLAPLSALPGARRAYWLPTDVLIRQLTRPKR